MLVVGLIQMACVRAIAIRWRVNTIETLMPADMLTIFFICCCCALEFPCIRYRRLNTNSHCSELCQCIYKTPILFWIKRIN